MKKSIFLTGSLLFLFISSPVFAVTCPSVENVNSAIEKFEVYPNGADKEKETNFMKTDNKFFFITLLLWKILKVLITRKRLKI